jgi:hypothetical protein
MKSLMIITAYLAPFFFIPATFRFAGGIFGRLSGMANDRTRGFFDRNRKYRAKERSDTWKRLKQGNRFQGESKLANRTNTALRYGSNATKARWALLGAVRPTEKGAQSRARVRARMSGGLGSDDFDEAADILKNADNNTKEMMNDDTVLNAVRHVGSDGQWGTESSIREFFTANDLDSAGNRQNSDQEIERRVQRVTGSMRGRSKRAYGMAMMMQNSTTGTGFDDVGDMFDAINQMAGDDRHLAASMYGYMKNSGGNTRRPDLFGMSFGAAVKNLDRQYNETRSATRLTPAEEAGDLDDAALTRVGATRAGYNSLSPERQRLLKMQNKALLAREATNLDLATSTLESQGAYPVVTMRKKYLTPLLEQLGTEYGEALAAGNTEGAKEAAAKISSLRQNMSAAPQENRKELLKLFDRVNIDITSKDSSDQQLGTQIFRTIPGAGASADGVVQELRTRAGLYEYGSGMVPGAPGAPPTPGAAPTSPMIPVWGAPAATPATTPTPPPPPPTPAASPWGAPAATPPPPPPPRPSAPWPGPTPPPPPPPSGPRPPFPPPSP